MIVVSLRFFTRRFKGFGFGADDWMSAVSLLLVTGASIVSIISTSKHLLGSHAYPPSVADSAGPAENGGFTTELFKIQQAWAMIMGPSRGTIKLSLLLLYRRSFLGRAFLNSNTVFLALATFYTVTYPFFIIFSCGTHFESLFGSFLQRATNCSQVPYINIYLDCMNLLLDLIVFVSPLPSIWQLQMQLSKKVAISGVFAVSMVGLVAAAVSTGMYLWLAYPPSGSLEGFFGLPAQDVIGHVSGIYFFQTVEVGVALVVSCMPVLWPLVHRPREALKAFTSKLSSSKVSLLGKGSSGNDGTLGDSSDAPAPSPEVHRYPGAYSRRQGSDESMKPLKVGSGEAVRNGITLPAFHARRNGGGIESRQDPQRTGRNAGCAGTGRGCFFPRSDSAAEYMAPPPPPTYDNRKDVQVQRPPRSMAKDYVEIGDEERMIEMRQRQLNVIE
ncbi:MAG: hypothetical protein M1831_001963 [Alyxoria varia]|nr:MAG: hypothetical protein M1831_001963 [Alyxoria varia]